MAKKTLADRIVRGPLNVRDDAGHGVAQLLKKPAPNHSDTFAPMVERFVVDVADYGKVSASNDRSVGLVMQNLRLPMETFWLEVGECGFFVQNGYVRLFWTFGLGTPLCIGVIDLDSIRDVFGLDLRDAFFVYSHCAGYFINWAPFTSKLYFSLAVFAECCSIINSPRSAAREVIRPGGIPSAQRATRHRRAQRGYPMFSFNRVTIRRPDTSLQSSGVLLCGQQTSKRGHWVIGHWRLIDNVPDPYWVWVEAHKRGDEGTGFISHERHVKIEPGSFGTRRGFVIPTDEGSPSQRVPAARH
ncbi:hypothetical protein ORIO_12520 [Cereibacter azotoformans]|uniref:hypothetical protein n=1 Tax=Cereibacter azotoformans TaxID=43057 RepID=UPI001EE9C771|nr:hypothetical protein [Cereibacter azotoformans]ULB10727.1 hypothetical protein ORIO_12520 [Cereibacter azotoformans]